MSQPAPPRPAKLVISLFLQDKDLIAPVVEDLRSLWGDLDQVSAWIPFDFTSYYASEMGEPLFRRVMTFEGLIQQSTLASIKQETNTIEAAYARAGRRRVNIDPGYLLAERFVLALLSEMKRRRLESAHPTGANGAPETDTSEAGTSEAGAKEAGGGILVLEAIEAALDKVDAGAEGSAGLYALDLQLREIESTLGADFVMRKFGRVLNADELIGESAGGRTDRR